MNRKTVYDIECRLKKTILIAKAEFNCKMNEMRNKVNRKFDMIYAKVEKLTINGAEQKIEEEQKDG